MIVRKRNIITLIECKFTETPVELGVIKDFEKKILALKVPKGSSIEKVLISAHGASSSVHQAEYFNRILSIEDII